MFNAKNFIECPSCKSQVRTDVFPALIANPTTGSTGQVLLVDSEASCFYHENKKAMVPCDHCGRFLCSLCDVELNGDHFCPSCVESGKKKNKLRNLQSHRTLYDSIALSLAVIPAIFVWPSIVTAPMALYVALRYWKTPLSIVPRRRWRFVLAMVLSVPQILGWSVVLYSVFT